jgi:uncharacterized protein
VAGNTVAYVGEKWGGRPHYAGTMHVLGEDEHGTWLWGPAGRTISRGDEPLFTTEQDALIVVPDEAWWAAAWWIGHPELELYVNIGTAAVRSPGTITYVDLDLDVVRRTDGSAEIVDQDEFEAHQVELAYPADIVEAAARVADEVLAAVVAAAAPFDGVAARTWTAAAREARLPVP